MSNIVDPEFLSELVLRNHKLPLTLEEVIEVLTLEEDAYERDSPRSVGKKLSLNYLQFAGAKNTGEPILYSRSFIDGVNMWVGDNAKGKSSIFKIIKYCITGNNTIAKEISSWLTDIWLEFSIGSTTYCTHIYKKPFGKLFIHELFSCSYQDIKEVSDEELEVLRLFGGGMQAYEDFMERFFFKEFDYYSLQWTQRSSSKSNPELGISHASWKTYFKSVFLEAEDNKILFYGNQAEIIVQMLLGLELTYPINRLKIRKEKLEDQIGQLQLFSNQTNVTKDEELSAAKKDQETLKFKLEQENKKVADIKPVNNSGVLKRLDEARQRYANFKDRRKQLEQDISDLEKEITDLTREESKWRNKIQEHEVEINKKTRNLNNAKELVEIGAFFVSLEVKHCPSCDHEVEKNRILNEKSTGNCRLCDHQVEHQKGDEEELEAKIAALNEQIRILESDKYAFKLKLAEVGDGKRLRLTSLNTKRKALDDINLNIYEKEILDIQEEIAIPVTVVDIEILIQTITDLKASLVRVEDKIKSLESISESKNGEIEALELKIRVLEAGRSELMKLQADKSASIIRQLEGLYLELLHNFGLYQYEQVKIGGNLSITYSKHQGVSRFEELSPGEQLRAKLGLYIAITEMDAKYSYGRHPGFIILDAPAGEEADSTFKEGLKETLSFIQETFGKTLQVFVGTAQRELQDAVDHNRVEVHGPSEFFF